jgi:hypothetical protein
MRARSTALTAAWLLAAWMGCGGDDGPARCDEARGYVCQKGAAGAGGSTSGASDAPPMGAGGSSMGGAGSGGSGGGGGLMCAAPTINCDGACIDVKAADATNCGACGRSCLGTATCSQGACVPEVMAANEVAPYALADDGSSLYWVSPAVKEGAFIPHMRTVSKASAGGSATNAFASVIVRARSLTFGGGKLFWGDLGASPSDTNQRLASGLVGGADATTIEAAQLNVQHLALAGTKVYWSLTGDSAVRGKNADGTGTVSPNVLGQSSVGWLALNEQARPYWLAGVPREVRRVKAASTSEHEKVADSPTGVAVEVFGSRVYWAEGTSVRSAPEATPATVTQEVDGLGRVEGLAVVASSGGGAAGAGGAAPAGDVTLYFLTSQGRQLKAWRKGPDDDAPLLLGEVAAKADPFYPAGPPFGASHVVVDAQYVYFADVGTVDTAQVVPTSQGDGVVYRVAR